MTGAPAPQRGAARPAQRAALDRWCQNLRRVAGHDVQYFAVVEPQKRAAPHAHLAIRGTLPRTLVKQLTAATYAQVWWPTTDTPLYTDSAPPAWDPTLNDGGGGFVDPDTGKPLQTWDQALEALEPGADDIVDTAEPRHLVRFGEQLDVKGVLAGSPQAERCIGYLVKYLVKDPGDDLDPEPHTDPASELDNTNEGPGRRPSGLYVCAAPQVGAPTAATSPTPPHSLRRAWPFSATTTSVRRGSRCGTCSASATSS